MSVSISERLAQFHRGIIHHVPRLSTSSETSVKKTPLHEQLERDLQMPVPLPVGWTVLRSIKRQGAEQSALREVVPGETIEVINNRLWCSNLAEEYESRAPDYFGFHSNEKRPFSVTYILIPNFYGKNGEKRYESDPILQSLRDDYLSRYGKGFDEFLHDVSTSDNRNYVYPIISKGEILIQLQSTDVRNTGGIFEKPTFYVPEVLAQAYFDEVMPESSVN